MRTLRTMILIFALATLTATAAAPAAFAQSGDAATVRAYIERNAELLRDAVMLVRETNSVKARTALEAAQKLHESSLSLLSSDRQLMAGRAARQARDAILRAVAIAKHETRLEQNAHRAIERAGNRLEQARAAFDETGGNDAARKLIEEAQVQLGRARANMQEHMFEVALKLARASHELSTRALGTMRRDNATEDGLRRALTRTDEVLARLDAMNAPTDRPAFQRALEEARDLQSQARRNASGGKSRLALEQTRRAREIALRMLKASGQSRGDDGARAERALRLTDEILESAMRLAREQGARDVVASLEEASRVQRAAKDRFRAGDPSRALELTRRAREMARAAAGDLERPLDPESARRALEQTDRIIRDARDAVADGGDDDASALLDRAAARQAQAWRAFNDGDARKALALTRVARRLANNAVRGASGDRGR